jgi:hypothetical protein
VRKWLLIFLIPLAFAPLSARAQEYDDEEEDFPGDDEIEVEEYSEYDEEEGSQEGTNERVKGFDIGGLALDMDYEKVRDAAKEHKFVLDKIDYSVPEYFGYNYDAQCRERNIFLSDSLKACIEGLAKKDKMHYVSRVDFKKSDNDERLSVFFTSPVTGHTVWKIEYSNNVNKRLGTAKNFQYQRDELRRAFWYNVQAKYGEPNAPPNRWVLDTNDEFSPELIALFGKLTLQSRRQYLFDASESVKEARRRFKFKDFSF